VLKYGITTLIFPLDTAVETEKPAGGPEVLAGQSDDLCQDDAGMLSGQVDYEIDLYMFFNSKRDYFELFVWTGIPGLADCRQPETFILI